MSDARLRAAQRRALLDPSLSAQAEREAERCCGLAAADEPAAATLANVWELASLLVEEGRYDQIARRPRHDLALLSADEARVAYARPEELDSRLRRLRAVRTLCGQGPLRVRWWTPAGEEVEEPTSWADVAVPRNCLALQRDMRRRREREERAAEAAEAAHWRGLRAWCQARWDQARAVLHATPLALAPCEEADEHGHGTVLWRAEGTVAQVLALATHLGRHGTRWLDTAQPTVASAVEEAEEAGLGWDPDASRWEWSAHEGGPVQAGWRRSWIRLTDVAPGVARVEVGERPQPTDMVHRWGEAGPQLADPRPLGVAAAQRVAVARLWIAHETWPGREAAERSRTEALAEWQGASRRERVLREMGL